MRQRSSVALTAGMAILVAAVGFVLGRTYFDAGASATASRPPAPSQAEVTPADLQERPADIDTSKPGWALAYLEADRALPRYDQVINGIRIGPTVGYPTAPACELNPAQTISIEEARTRDESFVFTVASLPEGAVVDRQQATLCGDEVTTVMVEIAMVASEGAGANIQAGESWFDVQHGGTISVYKARVAAPVWTSEIAAERWEASTIAGRPAAIGHAILRDEFGESAIVIWDEEHRTQLVVRGFEAELRDLLRIAEEALE